MLEIKRCLLPLILIIFARSAFATADLTPPQLVSIDFTPKSVDVSSASQTVTVTAHLTDDNTGVSDAAVQFGSPSSGQTVYAYFSRISGTAQDGMYQTLIT